MLNQVIVVGRLKEKPVLDGLNCKITLAVPRAFKNENGEYETDFIDCWLSGVIAQNTADWVDKGEIVGIKGRLEVIENKLTVIGEKVTFLSGKKKEEADEKEKGIEVIVD